MKYKHRKSGIIVWPDESLLRENMCYTNENNDFIPACVVEDSVEWIKVSVDIDKIKTLQDIRCLSINDIAKVYVTANRLRHNGSNNEYELEKQGRELIEIVKKRMEEQEQAYRKIAEELKTTRI
jgi:hypothetical protein